MQRQADPGRGWEALVVRLNASKGWGLDQGALARYCAALCAYIPADANPGLVQRICTYYHQDHQLFAALSDRSHGLAEQTWTDWYQWALAVLYKEGLPRNGDCALEAHDMAQTALLELVAALPSFRFQSTLKTWAYQVIVNTARRMLRDSRAQKRPQQCASLDQLPGFDQPIPAGEQPPAVTELQLLGELVGAVLAYSGDARMARIFLLHAANDYTTETIGRLVQLHPSRVRALLADARAILQHHPALQAWLAD